MDQTSLIFKRKDIFVALSLVIIVVGGFLYWKERSGLSNFEIGERITEETKKGIQKGVNAPGALIAKVESSSAVLTVPGILQYTNSERQREDISALLNNTELNRVAQIRMVDMFEKGYFEHVSPEGQSASSVSDDVGYEYVTVGENIAMGNFATDAVLVQAWMDSPGHRENIMREAYSEIGIAVWRREYKGRMTWIAVQIFAKPLSACPAVDQNLKQKLEREIAELEKLNTLLVQKEQELEALRNNNDTNAYNAKVGEYNGLVKEVNERAGRLKTMTDEYNVSVRAFNSCIK